MRRRATCVFSNSNHTWASTLDSLVIMDSTRAVVAPEGATDDKANARPPRVRSAAVRDMLPVIPDSSVVYH